MLAQVCATGVQVHALFDRLLRAAMLPDEVARVARPAGPSPASSAPGRGGHNQLGEVHRCQVVEGLRPVGG